MMSLPLLPPFLKPMVKLFLSAGIRKKEPLGTMRTCGPTRMKETGNRGIWESVNMNLNLSVHSGGMLLK